MYRRSDSDSLDDRESPVIVFAQRSPKLGLAIAVDPRWSASVLTQDAPEVAELLKDLAIRAKTDPDALWRHISSLNWGLLVTGECGRDLPDQLPILQILNRFEQLQ